jgi:Na+-translocating ferredoxin:NAD+ oxidoreductase subunit G
MKKHRFLLFLVLALSLTTASFAAGADFFLKELLPDATRFVFTQSGDLQYYKAYAGKDQLLGAVFKLTVNGYQGPIQAAASMSIKGHVLGIKIIKHNETPGIGSRIAGKPFLDQFIFKMPQDFDKIQTIGGATVSSQAVIDAVKEKIKAVLKDLEKK